MRTTTAGLAERLSLRSRPADTPGPVNAAGPGHRAGHRRGDLAAGLAAAAIVGQILFAQVTLLAVMIIVAIGRVSRWRPHWLAVSALASVTWLVAAGPARTAAAYAEGCRRLAVYVVESAAHPGHLAHPAVALAGVATWLPRQLPLALLAACGEAGIVLWLGWWRRESSWRWRPGLVAAGRRWVRAGTLSAGDSVTSDGFALGLVLGTGKLAGVSWSEAAHGVLLTGQDADQLGLAVACAALRRRKTVLILDCPGPAPIAARISDIARPLRVPVTETGGVAVADAVGRAIRARETVLIATSHRDAARQAASELAGVLRGLRDLGLRADCVTWIRGAECLEPGCLTELLALGPLTGNAVVVSTTSPADATPLARETAVVVVSGPVGTELALGLTAPRAGTSQVPSAAGLPSRPPVKLRPPTGPATGLRLPSGPTIGRQSADDALLAAADPTLCPMESAAGRPAGSTSRTTSYILARQRAGEFTVFAGMRPDSRSARVTVNCRVVPIRPDRLR
jgi:hypothetical protein